jgi:hypothetical protein
MGVIILQLLRLPNVVNALLATFSIKYRRPALNEMAFSLRLMQRDNNQGRICTSLG